METRVSIWCGHTLHWNSTKIGWECLRCNRTWKLDEFTEAMMVDWARFNPKDIEGPQ